MVNVTWLLFFSLLGAGIMIGIGNKYKNNGNLEAGVSFYVASIIFIVFFIKSFQLLR